MTSERPFSQACENNKAAILDRLRVVAGSGQTVLEVGSGTAQHVRHFAGHLPAVSWQPSEIRRNLPSLQLGLKDHGCRNILPPLIAEAGYGWPPGPYDGVFSANCLHIMSAPCVEAFMAAVPGLLTPGGFLCLYGPFRYRGDFTSPSNARFDEWLKARDPESGIRDFEWVSALAGKGGLRLLTDHCMPANNQFLLFEASPGLV